MIRRTKPLVTTSVRTPDEIQAFFDRFAAFNEEHHGEADKLLAYRMQILNRYAQFSSSDRVLDVGCGNGKHLFALDGQIREGIGIDFSPGMIATARHSLKKSFSSSFSFYKENAIHLDSIPDQSVDVIICTGVLEHVVEKESMMHATHRVLRPGGRFVCLTLNDQFLWYRNWAPALGYATRHLSTDRRLSVLDAQNLLAQTPFTTSAVHYWTFIPKGDMPSIFAVGCRLLDKAGHVLAPSRLRSGLVLYGIRE